MTLLFAFLIGFFAGLRSLTAPATTAWAGHLGWLKLERPLSLIGSVPSVIILTLLAAAELVADKLPNKSRRTSAPGLIARIITGGLSGAFHDSRAHVITNVSPQPRQARRPQALPGLDWVFAISTLR